jgi:hypothetical protein
MPVLFATSAALVALALVLPKVFGLLGQRRPL